MAFNKEAFNAAFEAAIIRLADSEKITKQVLLDLSRSVLVAHHETEDIGYINRLLVVLTPMNRGTANLYFSEFSGFNFSAKSGEFGKKDKKNYEAAKIKAAEFLDDPLNNIWTWAARNVTIEAKEFDEERMKKSLENTLKKADKAGFSQAQVLKAMLSAGLSIDALFAIMDEVKDQIKAPVGQAGIGGA